MWLITTDGFFSAVQDRDDHDVVVVRTRVRDDAAQLAVAVGSAVIETPAADYRFRVRMTKQAWSRYLANRAAGIDYDNFKNAVAVRQGSRRAQLYGSVWALLLRLQDRDGGRAQ